MKSFIKRLVCLIPPVRKCFERLQFLEQEAAKLETLLHQSAVNLQQLEAALSTWSRFFFHALPGTPCCDHGFALGAAITRNEELVGRIAHIAATSDFDVSGKGYVWDVLANAHKPYAAALDHERLALLAAAPLTSGLLQGDTMTALLRENEQQRAHWANAALDALLSLCEAMELIPIENVELGVRCRVERGTPDQLLDAVSDLVGFEVYAPDVFTDLFGLQTKRGVFTFRHFIAFYAAWRLAAQFGDKETIRIAEIGAGAGLTAYYARQFGFMDYTIFDLPTVNIVQSWFLGQSLPETPLILADDPTPFAHKGFRVLPPEFLGKAPDGFWSVVVNIDSIPEIDPTIVAHYLATLRRKTRFIYSYNHEACPPLDGRRYCDGDPGEESPSEALFQEPVAWHTAQDGGYARLSRNRAWLRPGYVEEWYERKSTCSGSENNEGTHESTL